MLDAGTHHEVCAVLAGDAGARDRLVERLRPRLVLWAAARMSAELRRECEPEDVAQDVLLAVHRDLERLAPEDPDRFLPWLFTVAENRLRDLVDRVRAGKRNGTPRAAERVRSPSSIVGAQEMADRVVGALDRLCPDHREVIRLRRFEELSAAEAGERMGRSEGAVRVLYFRAVAALRDALEEESA